MDDLTSKITQILNDPDGMKKVQALANQVLGSDYNSSTKEQEEQREENNSFNIGDVMQNINPAQLQGIMKVMNLLNSKKGDNSNTHLLLALKPHLSEERASKVDKAISMLKIADILPLLQQTDIFSSLFGG